MADFFPHVLFFFREKSRDFTTIPSTRLHGLGKIPKSKSMIVPRKKKPPCVVGDIFFSCLHMFSFGFHISSCDFPKYYAFLLFPSLPMTVPFVFLHGNPKTHSTKRERSVLTGCRALLLLLPWGSEAGIRQANIGYTHHTTIIIVASIDIQ